MRWFHKINLIGNKNLFLHGKKCNAINYKLTVMTHCYKCYVHGVCFIVPLCITSVIMQAEAGFLCQKAGVLGKTTKGTPCKAPEENTCKRQYAVCSKHAS